MDETPRVRRVERVGDLARDRDGAGRPERPLPARAAPEVAPVDVAHRDEQAPVGLARLVDRDDVRVVEARREPRLPEEPLAELLVVGEARAQQLQGDGALEPRIERAVDLAHAATADEPLDRVAGDELTRRNPPSDRHRPSRVVVAGCTIAALEECGGRTAPGRRNAASSPQREVTGVERATSGRVVRESEYAGGVGEVARAASDRR